jgi:tetratricopeptide (TPR) repeat protein
MNVEAWGAEAFDAAQSLANEGDELFNAQRFDEAIEKYDTGSTALEALVAAGETQFQTALAQGDAAIERRDAGAAAAAYTSAAIIFPEHPRVTTGIARAERLPEVLNLWDSANRHQVRGEWDEALADFAAIKELDANTTGIDEAVAIVRAEIAERDFQSQVSRGYAALDAGRFDTALKAFNAALAMRPGDPAATDGRKQVLQGRTLARIERLRVRAAGLAEAEDWQGAEKAYGEVLAVDGSLKFARDGQQEARSRAALNTALDNAIANPGNLSSDKAFADTVALFERAVGVKPAGPELTAQLDRLESILEVAAEPVRLTLVSDNATQVKIYQVGNLGVFARKDVHVRPGRYVITGSRDGCRDVRKEVTVTPDMAPIDIRCQERI